MDGLIRRNRISVTVSLIGIRVTAAPATGHDQPECAGDTGRRNHTAVARQQHGQCAGETRRNATAVTAA